MIPLLCAALSASAISVPKSSISSRGRGLPRMRCFSVSPSRSSMTMKDWSPFFPISWMVQGRSSTRLPAKTFHCMRVLGQAFRQEFQGDEAAKLRILGLVHHTHPATAKLFDDAVMRDGLSDE